MLRAPIRKKRSSIHTRKPHAPDSHSRGQWPTRETPAASLIHKPTALQRRISSAHTTPPALRARAPRHRPRARDPPAPSRHSDGRTNHRRRAHEAATHAKCLPLHAACRLRQRPRRRPRSHQGRARTPPSRRKVAQRVCHGGRSLGGTCEGGRGTRRAARGGRRSTSAAGVAVASTRLEAPWLPRVRRDVGARARHRSNSTWGISLARGGSAQRAVESWEGAR